MTINRFVALCVATLVIAGSGCSRQGSSSHTSETGSDKSIWTTDFEGAKAKAAANQLPILALFTGSDWCPWCVKLDREVFAEPAFRDYAVSNLVLFIADFPNAIPQPDALKRQNQALQQQYQVEGFPTVVLLDSTGKELARTGYERGGAKDYVDHLKNLL